MEKKQQWLKQGGHEIGYAYASSTIATKDGFSAKGCYYYTTDPSSERVVPFERFEEAESYAKSQGTKPHQWSMDHVINAKYRARKGLECAASNAVVGKEKEGV